MECTVCGVGWRVLDYSSYVGEELETLKFFLLRKSLSDSEQILNKEKVLEWSKYAWCGFILKSIMI